MSGGCNLSTSTSINSQHQWRKAQLTNNGCIHVFQHELWPNNHIKSHLNCNCCINDVLSHPIDEEYSITWNPTNKLKWSKWLLPWRFQVPTVLQWPMQLRHSQTCASPWGSSCSPCGMEQYTQESQVNTSYGEASDLCIPNGIVLKSKHMIDNVASKHEEGWNDDGKSTAVASPDCIVSDSWQHDSNRQCVCVLRWLSHAWWLSVWDTGTVVRITARRERSRWTIHLNSAGIS